MSAKEAARRAYEAFHGERAGKVAVSRLPDNDVIGYRLGQMTAAAYRTRRDGRMQEYIHEFGRGAGPFMDVAHDGTAIYLTGGDFCVTDHGIEDHKMPALLAINPHKRGSKPKYKVLNMAGAKRNKYGQFVKTAKAKAPARKSNPIARAKTAKAPARSAPSRRNSPQIIYMAPETRTKPRKSNPIRSYGSRSGGLGINFGKMAIAGGSQAIGAVTVSAAFAMIQKFLPVAWRTGPMAIFVKVALGAILGVGISKFGRKSAMLRQFAQDFSEGTVTLAFVEWLQAALPKLSTMGDITYAGDEMAMVRNVDGSLGQVIPMGDGTMRLITAAQVVDDFSGVGAQQYQSY